MTDRQDLSDHILTSVLASAPAPAPSPTERPRIAIGLERKLNDGNYGAYGVSLHVSGVTADTTDAEIDELLSGRGKIAYAKMIAELGPKLEEARRQ